jgi:hypothetical protein
VHRSLILGLLDHISFVIFVLFDLAIYTYHMSYYHDRPSSPFGVSFASLFSFFWVVICQNVSIPLSILSFSFSLFAPDWLFGLSHVLAAMAGS